MKTKKITNLLIVLVVACTIKVNSQTLNSAPPVHFPTAPSAWEFTKYGDIGVSEYNGLANISIPFHTLSCDGVSIPFELTYYSGGIRVSEEASMVGLGWSFNIPTVIQQINGYDDYDIYTLFQKLPPYQGNPAVPTNAIYPLITPGMYNADVTPFQGVGTTQNDPYFTNVIFDILVDNTGYYNTNHKYQYVIGNSMIDTQPDIFTLSLNGVTIKFCRDETTVDQYNSDLQILPLKVINGHTEYKVEVLTPGYVSGSTATIRGIKVTDPMGNIYEFSTIEFADYTYRDPYDRWFPKGATTSISYKLTKVTTQKGKEINFTYSAPVPASRSSQKSMVYSRRVGPTEQWVLGDGEYTSFGTDAPVYYHSDMEQVIDQHYEELPFGEEGVSQRFLESITAPDETIKLTYGSRTDYGSKCLKNFEVQNLYDQKILKYDLAYSYFSSGSRLKLDSVTKEGDNPYLFTYNATQLPAKNSYNIDYWGFYNGHYNASLLPDLTELGYPQYTENIANDFNSNLQFAKAGTLEKITYPTKGYTVFTYGLHVFDNLLQSMGGQTPVINTGAGLRIEKTEDFESDGTLLNSRFYTYYGGKCLSKRVMVKQSVDRHWKCDYVVQATPMLLANLSNFVNQTPGTEGGEIGYDSVKITETGNDEYGYIVKTFANTPLKCINPYGVSYPRAAYSEDYSKYPNGTLLSEKTYDANGQPLMLTEYKYSTISSYGTRYGLTKQNNGIQATGFLPDSGWPPCPGYVNNFPKVLLMFYPIRGRSLLMQQKKTTEYLKSSRIRYETYSYDDKNNISSIINKSLPGNIMSTTNYTMSYTSYSSHEAKNILALRETESSLINGLIQNKLKSYYTETNGAVLLIKQELQHKGNPYVTSDLLIDHYDEDLNIGEFHLSGGMHTAIVWGYNGTLPVAKIENVTYSQILPYIATLKTTSATNNPTAFRNALAAFRNSVMSQYPMARITTYEYQPGKGVARITDPKGDFSEFTYDTLNRLLSVKDANGNLLNEFEYRLKP